MDIVRYLGSSPHELEASHVVTAPLIVEESDGRVYGEAPLAGLSVVIGDDGLIGTLQLHAEGYEGYASFAGELPFGLRFDMSRSQVRSVLGVPESTGDEQTVPHLGSTPAWDKFELEGILIHVQYGFGLNSIQLVSLEASDSDT